MTGKVLTSHLFNHLDIHKGNTNMYNMVLANVLSKTKNLDIEHVKEINSALNRVKDHLYLNQSSFFALLHTTLEDIQQTINSDEEQTQEISIVLNELIHFVNHHINGRIL